MIPIGRSKWKNLWLYLKCPVEGQKKKVCNLILKSTWVERLEGGPGKALHARHVADLGVGSQLGRTLP